eukprot:4552166-Prorocentrum_lima.AAC.1
MHLPSAGQLAKCGRHPAAPVRAASACRAPALQCHCKKCAPRWSARFALAVACICSTTALH